MKWKFQIRMIVAGFWWMATLNAFSQVAKKEKDIASLPAMIQHVLSVQQHLPKNPADEEKKQLVYQNIEMVVKRLCDKIRRAQNEIETSVQNNSIRYEMFLCTSKVGVQEAFQQQDYVRGWFLSSPDQFLKQYSKSLDEFVKPLRKVFLDTDHSYYLNKGLNAPIKSMLLLCSELAVKALEIFPFEGRICKLL